MKSALPGALQLKLNLFGSAEPALPPGSLAMGTDVRRVVSETLSDCNLSRIQIAEDMSALLGGQVTKPQLDAWSADSKDGHRFPVEYLPAFVHATKSRKLLDLVATRSNCYVINESDALRLELGRISEEEKRLKEQRRLISQLLGGAQ